MELRTSDTAVVLGCGKAGLSAVRFLRQMGVQVLVSESREEKDLPLELIDVLREQATDYECGAHNLDFIRQADFLVPSPGVPLDAKIIQAARTMGVNIYGELGLAAGRFKVPVIAVTGSNGKTTVTGLVGKLLAQNGARVFIGGNIGTPLLDFFTDGLVYDAAVLELSSFQLELVGAFRADVAVVLNLSPDHLDRHHSMERYTEAKRNLLRNQIPGDAAVLGVDDPVLRTWAAYPGVRVLRFGQDAGHQAWVRDHDIVLQAEDGQKTERFPLEATRLSSLVNRLNAAAAVLAASSYGVPPKVIQSGLEAFVPPPHRMEPVAVLNGVRYINDSKATNIGAMAAALASCKESVVLIAGGRDKKSDFSSVITLMAEKVKHLILMGEAAPIMENAFQATVPVTRVPSMNVAVTTAATMASEGDVVLLAPGCASFDMYTGYDHRGRVFTDCVVQLAKQHLEGERGQ
ncbi:MAG: UDP-N-acetylmuramoyl-L-alanine--D-glutamate ligase [Desulfobulbus propionicus]|nr:MAG: UDP-N-acetylmuramoyl-L-alanine--D-glutamate ligase [Desulfobulbus propionicus]